MIPKRLLHIVVLFGLGVLVGWFPMQRAQGQETGASSFTAPSPTAPQAAVGRVATVSMPSFTPYSVALVHVNETYNGELGTLFTYTPLDSYPITNLTHSANSGVTCSHDANLKVTCTGSNISWVVIDYDFEYLVSDYSSDLLVLGWGGTSNYALDFTIHLVYPAPLTYVGAYATEPISVTATEVTWFMENTTQLYGYGYFRDERISVVSLPLLQH